MLSYHAIAWPHWGQCEPGQATDSCRGRRWMQTLRKLPTTRPTIAATTRAVTSVMMASYANHRPQITRMHLRLILLTTQLRRATEARRDRVKHWAPKTPSGREIC